MHTHTHTVFEHSSPLPTDHIILIGIFEVKNSQLPIPVVALSKGAHTRTSLARESGWARVPMSQTRPCVECHEPESTHACVVKYIRAWLPSQAPRGGLASETCTCMGTLRLVYGRSLSEIVGSNPAGGKDVCPLWMLCRVGSNLCDGPINRPGSVPSVCVCVCVCHCVIKCNNNTLHLQWTGRRGTNNCIEDKSEWEPSWHLSVCYPGILPEGRTKSRNHTRYDSCWHCQNLHTSRTQIEGPTPR